MLFKTFLLLCVVTTAYTKSVTVGQVYDSSGQIRKVYETSTERNGFIFMKREEEIYFEYPVPDKVIKGIKIIDLENGMAEPSITRGGIGFNFANIKLKSERGSGYKFSIEIYA